MNAEYFKDANKNYLVISGTGEETELQKIAGKMLKHNVIEGVVRFETRIIDHEKNYYYDITGRQPVLSGGTQKFSFRKIYEIISEILEIVERGFEYLLLPDDFLINERHIFEKEGKIELCCFPGYGKEIFSQLEELSLFFMEHIDYKEEEAVLLVYGLNRVSTTKNVTLQEIDKFLKERREKSEDIKTEILQKPVGIKPERKNPPKEQEGMKGKEQRKEEQEKYVRQKAETLQKRLLAFVTVFLAEAVLACFLYQQGILYNSYDSWNLPLMAGLLGSAAVTFVAIIFFLFALLKENAKLEELEEPLEIRNIAEDEFAVLDGTVYLPSSGNRKEKLYVLVPDENTLEEKISMEEFPCFIGKDKRKNKGICENRAVSRYHARIDCIEGKYYVTDLDSTNGTYVNHIKIPPHEKCRIREEDSITFANATYYFRATCNLS